MPKIKNGSIAIKAIQLGDVDENGEVQPYDASLILRYLVNDLSLTSLQLQNSDATGDGTVSTFDATKILQYVVGSVSSLPDSTAIPAGGNMYFSEPTVENEIIDLPVVLNNPQNIYSLALDLKYNPEYLEIVSMDYASEMSSALISEGTTEDKSEVKIAAADDAVLPLDRNLVHVRFRMKKDFDTDENGKIYLRNYRLNEMNSVQNGDSVNFGILTAVKQQASSIPAEFVLKANYPNPFNPTTTIAFGLPEKANIHLTIFNVVGQEIAELYSGELSAGYHQLQWNGRNQSDYAAPSGIYFYRMDAVGLNDAKHFTDTKKMILLK